jgi:hypothetical protein
MFQINLYRKLKTHFMIKNFFLRKSCRIWDNVEKYDTVVEVSFFVYIHPTFQSHFIQILWFVSAGGMGRCDWGTRRNSQSALWLATQCLVLSKFEKLLLHICVCSTGSYNRAVPRMCLRLPCLSGNKWLMECLEISYLLHVVTMLRELLISLEH